MDASNVMLILAASLLAGASPGPATMTIAGTAMQQGHRPALALAAGVTTGSLIWSCSAALGLAAIMLSNAWIIEALRYAGAGYLMFLAFKSARSALRAGTPEVRAPATSGLWSAYAKGLALHLTNPKAVLFFGSLYAIGLPADTTTADLATIILLIAAQSALVFHGYAVLFSSPVAVVAYARLRRGFEALFAAAFAAASLKILTARIG